MTLSLSIEGHITGNAKVTTKPMQTYCFHAPFKNRHSMADISFSGLYANENGISVLCAIVISHANFEITGSWSESFFGNIQDSVFALT